MFKYLTCCFVSFFCFQAASQNTFPQPPHPEYFKTMPPIDAATPGWAVLMYRADPNVFEVTDSYGKYFRENEFKKTIHVQNYKHWLKCVQRYVDNEGHVRPPSREQEDAFYQKIKTRRNGQPQRSAGPWAAIGPFETYKAGTTTPNSNQVNVYSLDQSASNPDVLFAGTESGGVYKSVDHGLNWSAVSIGEEFSGGNTSVEIHPTNPDIVIVASNQRLYRTADGGTAWAEATYLNGTGHEVKFRPSNPDSVFCAASNGLYLSTDAGATWPTQVFTQTCHDVEWHTADPDTLYLLKSNTAAKRSELFMSPDAGASSHLKDNGYYTPADPANASIEGGKIALTAAAPDRIYVCLIGAGKAGDDGWIGLLRSDNRGEWWALPAGQYGGPYQAVNTMPWNVAAYSDGYHQGFYNFDCEASPNDPDLLWVGTIRLSESANGGASFVAIGAANSTRLDDLHADIQDIEVNGDEVWVANDGGIEHSLDKLQSFASQKKGIDGSNFWGFGSGWNEDVLVGGRYHNGNSGYYQAYGTGNSIKLGGVEESTGYVHPMNNRLAFFNQYWSGGTAARSVPTAIGGDYTDFSFLPLIPNESYAESSSSGLYFDPRYANHYFMGEGSSIWKSTNAGVTFQSLNDFGAGGLTLEIEISRSNPDFIYVVFKPSGSNARRIYRTPDGGETWDQLTNLPANNRNKIEITLNPEDENELWACANDGANANKVYRTLDGGSTWLNMTTPALDGEHPYDIFYQGGTDGVVYLATYLGVFYFDENTNDWAPYSDGLPLIVRPLQMKPFHRDGKLRLATSGIGIWENTLAAPSRPLAQPITYADSIYCARDTVQFDCYSILDHAGASWQWAFDPAPLWVSSTTARNPQVVFGANGSFDVSLSVTDGSGLSDTKSIPEMVQVDSRCDVDTIPGLAMKCAASGDWTAVPDLGLTTNVMTISAWVKPNGIQPDYAGIVMNDGDAAGFNFREGNNTLGYHWPGGQWWWDSGLQVPANVWSHVAMVANETGMTLYLDGVAASQNIALNPTAITTLKIGSYKGWGDRNFSGELDEVAIWQRALTQNEIRELMHLTLDDVITDDDLLAYYQFNEPGTTVLDKKGMHHASLAGAALKLASNAPLGGSTSQRLTVSSGGQQGFGSTGLTLDFPPSAAYPNGELVAFRINVPPDVLPQGANLPSDSVYWVVRNFGTNGSFSELESIRFDGVPLNAPANVATPGDFVFYKRNSNDFGPTWGTSQDAADAVTNLPGNATSVVFGAGNGITSFSQFALGYDATISSAFEHQPSAKMGDLHISPNPTKGHFFIEMEAAQNGPAKLEIFRQNGQLVHLEHFIFQAGKNRLMVNAGVFPAGTYMVRIQTGAGQFVGRVVLAER